MDILTKLKNGTPLNQSETNALLLSPGILHCVDHNYACLIDPKTPEVLMRLLAKHQDPGVLEQLASNPGTPLQVLEQLEIQNKSNRNTLKSAVHSHSHWPSEKTLWEVVSINHLYKLSPQQRQHLVEEKSIDILIDIAKSSLLGYFDLAQQIVMAKRILKETKSQEGRYMAMNPLTHSSVLEILARRFAAECTYHPECPPHILEKAARSTATSGHRWEARYRLAIDPKTPLKVLEILSQDRINHIRLIASHRLQWIKGQQEHSS